MSLRQNTSTFEVDVECDAGVTHIGFHHTIDGSQIDIGTGQLENGTSKPTTQLLRSNIRSAIGKELLLREGFLHSAIRSERAPHEIRADGGRHTRQIGALRGKYLRVLSGEDSSCDLFEWICDATGGQSGHNICTW